MKAKIIKIAKDLERGKITVKTAQSLLLDLFGVGLRVFDEPEEEDDMDITRCPDCGSTDHTMIIGMPYRCMDCGCVF